MLSNGKPIPLKDEIADMQRIMLRKLADEIVFLKKAVKSARDEMTRARHQAAFDILCNEISRWGDLPQPGATMSKKTNRAQAKIKRLKDRVKQQAEAIMQLERRQPFEKPPQIVMRSDPLLSYRSVEPDARPVLDAIGEIRTSVPDFCVQVPIEKGELQMGIHVVAKLLTEFKYAQLSSLRAFADELAKALPASIVLSEDFRAFWHPFISAFHNFEMKNDTLVCYGCPILDHRIPRFRRES